MPNNTNNTTSTGGIGFVDLLTIVFITLKLTGYITWSWWWVLSPIWITWAVVFAVVGIILIAYATSKGK